MSLIENYTQNSMSPQTTYRFSPVCIENSRNTKTLVTIINAIFGRARIISIYKYNLKLIIIYTHIFVFHKQNFRFYAIFVFIFFKEKSF